VVSNQRLILNGIFHATKTEDRAAVAFERRGQEALATMPGALGALPRQEIALSPRPLLGANALRTMFADGAAVGPVRPPAAARRDVPAPLVRLVDKLEAPGRGVIMTMGKGGVGKTTVAAAIALELTRRGHPVWLSTTDPAAHVSGARPSPG